uniref:Uncharacterized protein n=1 Tax=Anguilla anguilla TaxID=7936 RepID=A0A0E9TLI3_ANGAN
MLTESLQVWCMNSTYEQIIKHLRPCFTTDLQIHTG